MCRHAQSPPAQNHTFGGMMSPDVMINGLPLPVTLVALIEAGRWCVPSDQSGLAQLFPDRGDAAESLALVLRMEGHEVRVAHDGPAALAAVQAELPHLVFLDIGMPVMNGYDVAQRLRPRPGLESLVLVAMTGWGQEEDRRRSHEAGFDHYLIKPVEPDALRPLLAGGKVRSP
jgi:CheY-like chemotaxis protein